MLGPYYPRNQPDAYVFKSIGTALEQYRQAYENFYCRMISMLKIHNLVFPNFWSSMQQKNVMKEKC